MIRRSINFWSSTRFAESSSEYNKYFTLKKQYLPVKVEKHPFRVVTTIIIAIQQRQIIVELYRLRVEAPQRRILLRSAKRRLLQFLHLTVQRGKVALVLEEWWPVQDPERLSNLLKKYAAIYSD